MKEERQYASRAEFDQHQPIGFFRGLMTFVTIAGICVAVVIIVTHL